MISVCLSNELNKFCIYVLSIHPGQVLIDCGSNDASESPKDTGRLTYPGIAELNW